MIVLGKPQLGNKRVVIDAPFYQAGLAGYSDAAMRLVARRHGCPYCVTEAMLDMFLLNGGRGLREAELRDDDHPIAGQLMGSHPAEIAEASKVLVSLGYDVVDVNLACPVKKIKKRARGGHLLSVPDEAIDILKAVIDAVGSDVPVTVKLRRSYDDTPEMVAGFHRIFEQVLELGYSGATVHSRTVQQKYVGPGHRPALREIAERYGLSNSSVDFVLGGSGDVWTARDIFDMLDSTGVGIVSVARGCIGNPWVFHQARAMMAGQGAGVALVAPTVFEQRAVLLEHLDLSVALHGEVLASRMMRKFGLRFARHHVDEPAIRKAFIAAATLTQWHDVIAAHYSTDAPGVPPDEALPPEAGELDTCDVAEVLD